MGFGTRPEDPAWKPTELQSLQLPEIPNEDHFIRDHFPVPELDAATWRIEIEGEREQLSLSEADLRALPARTLGVVLECAGHRRTELRPVPEGLPWEAGAISEARWTGTSLGPLLRRAGIPDHAVEVVLAGADSGLVEGACGRHHYARSLPLAKALERDVLLAYEMGGEPIPVRRGGPVRAIVPGWYGTDSVKWLVQAWFVAEPFQGHFQADDYLWHVPGEPGKGRRMTSLPVHALITSPAARATLPAAGALAVTGIAWGGTRGISRVCVRIDGGPWRNAHLVYPRGRYGRSRWDAEIELEPGIHELVCCAVDGAGRAQPERPVPNTNGYANNAMHRIAVLVG